MISFPVPVAPAVSEGDASEAFPLLYSAEDFFLSASKHL